MNNNLGINYFDTAPCQNVLDYFRSVLQFHNQLVQPIPEEPLTEVTSSSLRLTLTLNHYLLCPSFSKFKPFVE